MINKLLLRRRPEPEVQEPLSLKVRRVAAYLSWLLRRTHGASYAAVSRSGATVVILDRADDPMVHTIGTVDMVAEFHRAMNAYIAQEPGFPADDNLLHQRISLLQEELSELSEAFASRDLVKALDALTDLQYVLDGTYLTLGLHRIKDAAFEEVHASNMTKERLADGKVASKIAKGPNYRAPNLAPILQEDAERRLLGEQGGTHV